jgi:predicted nucleic acid-binding protein
VKWLLDTNVVSEGVRERPSRSVVGWLASRPREDFAISIVTLAELHDGALSIDDDKRRKRVAEWIEGEIAKLFHDSILHLTKEILVDWLQLARKLRMKGHTRDASDLLIAATARVHNLILVTRNVRHFAGAGVVVYDPWTDKTHVTDVS